MHELSIAASLLELVSKHAPPPLVVRRVVIDAGPLQGLDPSAMQWAWQSTVAQTHCHDATLEINMLPWRMRCAACNREWTAPEMATTCDCGAAETFPVSGNELLLKTIEVDDPPR